MVAADPFQLFPASVETARLVKLAAPGLPETVLTDQLAVIVKRRSQSNQPADYGMQDADWAIHVHPNTVPEPYANSPELLLDMIVELASGRRFLIVDASHGYDYTAGRLQFLYLAARPYGKDGL